MKLIGIDLGTRKVALSFFKDGELTKVESYVAPESASRHRQLYMCAEYVYHAAGVFEPDWIWMESIIVGNNRKYSIMLAEMSGAVQSELCALEADLLFGIGAVDNKQWKREIIGNGNANKEMIQEWVKKNHHGYAMRCGADQDKYDATCIGLYGLGIVGRADGLTLD